MFDGKGKEMTVMKKGFRIIILIGLILSAAALAGLFAARDDIIIQIGIVAYRSLIKYILIFAGILAGSGILHLLLGAVLQHRNNRKREEQERLESARARAKAEAEADLSVSRKLDTNVIRNMLKKEGRNQWECLADSIGRLVAQMDQMDDYQAKLSELLKRNDAGSLKDTEEVLDQVEQYICRNMRKALNYLSILRSDDAGDRKKAQEQLRACAEDNEQQLKQVQEFLLALADLLNMQGSGTAEIETLEMYKNIILESLKREENSM